MSLDGIVSHDVLLEFDDQKWACLVCQFFWGIAMFDCCKFADFCKDIGGVAFIIFVSLMPDSGVLFLVSRFRDITTTLKFREVK